MESSLVSDLFDNSNIGLSSREAISVIKNFFKEYIPEYELTDEYIEAGYWGVKYVRKELIVFFEGDVGGVFSTNIIIDGKDYQLWQYDRSILNASKTNTRNLKYVLTVFKQFIED